MKRNKEVISIRQEDDAVASENTAADVKVMPFDTVTVYSTEAVKDIYPKVGSPITVHPVAAAKLVADGKATEGEATVNE